MAFLLLREGDKVTFLNNSNMPDLSADLQRLIHELESEIFSIQLKKEELIRTSGPDIAQVMGSDETYLDQALKKSRFKKNLYQVHKMSKSETREIQAEQVRQQTRTYLIRDKKLKSFASEASDDLQVSEDSVAVSEHQFDVHYRELHTLKKAFDLLEESPGRIDANVMAKLKGLREAHQKDVMFMLKRKEMLDVNK